uniref:Putative TRAP-type C4-dicarboxylate transport system, periplasmic component n=1 Tax=Magnetococcus massalia (strain MO-1) TaxID=451514 RepID=A0A1S7LM44_MAGMO|nr:Putative TRAP-type C4-dicarboxylate transport system, periplasmic component [Candidatus Magnetococcus massalia]
MVGTEGPRNMAIFFGRVFAIILLLASPLGATALYGQNSAPEQVVIAHMFAAGSPPDQLANQLAPELKKILSLKRVTVAGGARLGDERDNLRQLQQDEIELAIVGTLIFSYLTPEYRLIVTPFLHRTLEQVQALYTSSLGDEIRARVRQQGVEILGWYCIGQRLLTANRPIIAPQQLRGLKLRLPPDPAWQATWHALGTAPRIIAFPQLYDALKQGEVEAQENPASLIRAKKFYQVQRYLMLTKHLVQTQFVVVSNRFMQRLTPGQQQQLRQLVKGYAQQACDRTRKNQQSDIQWLTTHGGMQAIELDLFPQAEQILPHVARSLDGDAGVALFKRIKEIP